VHRANALFVAVVVAAASGPAEAGPRLEPVAEGVFAVLQPTEKRFDDSNSVVVTLGDALLVVDAQATLEATAATIAVIRKTSPLPVRWLVLTHWHGDHVQGAAAYRAAWPAVEVVGQASLGADVPGRAEAARDADIEQWATAIAAAEGRLERGVDREGARLDAVRRATLSREIGEARHRLDGMRAVPRPLVVPDAAFEQERTIEHGGRTVRLLHRIGHTRGDTLIWVPDVGVLATGDLLDDLPFGGHGYPTAWVGALRDLEALPVVKIVPGHGSVRDGAEHLATVRALLEAIVDQVASAVADGAHLETTQQRVELGRFRRLLVGDDAVAAPAWEAFVPATIERAWLEARGELPD
jgi:glyoxylase-like metal-dependent hydrolase (beta-lactamase superfamily II)